MVKCCHSHIQQKATYKVDGLIATFRLVSVLRGYAQEKERLSGTAKNVLFTG